LAPIAWRCWQYSQKVVGVRAVARTRFQINLVRFWLQGRVGYFTEQPTVRSAAPKNGVKVALAEARLPTAQGVMGLIKKQLVDFTWVPSGGEFIRVCGGGMQA